MKYSAPFTLLILALLLAACAPAASTPQLSTDKQIPSASLTRADSQGAVTFEVTPLSLDSPGDALQFDVSMNTHSVDLSMDLATLATLTTDTGLTVQATRWDAPKGGHHVEGKLFFASVKDGKSILDGAKQVTLTIKNVDAPERTFIWELPAN